MEVRVSEEIGTLIDEAAQVSIRQGTCYVGVEHLFEAIVSRINLLPESFANSHLKTFAQVSRTVQADAWKGAPPPIVGEVFYTPRFAFTTNEASSLAKHMRSDQTSSGHLLLAILKDRHSGPSRAIDKLDMDRQTIAGELERALLSTSGMKNQTSIVRAPKSAGGPAPVSVSADRDNGDSGVTLESFTRDLTQDAIDGELTEPIGREKEVLEVVEIMSRKEKNNVILVGEPGVGKTKIIEGLAVGCEKGSLRQLLGKKRFLELNIAALMSGTQYRGAFETKMLALVQELEASRDTILCIDEIHLIMGSGSTDGDSMDMANILKPALSRGRLRVIGATTLEEYRRFIGKDPAIERRFQLVRCEALGHNATHKILKAMAPALEKHHRVKIGKGVATASIKLSERYMPNRHLPDKAIDVFDQACARYRLKRMLAQSHPDALDDTTVPRPDGKVSVHDVRKVISQVTSIPIDDMSDGQKSNLADLEQNLNRIIIGQDQAVARAVSAVKKSGIGMADPNRPDAVMLFLGPTGVGKTQLCKELAKSFFGSSDSLITFDMSEFIESHSVSKLIGAPPGYVGAEEEGRLTSAVKDKPHSMLLFDEVEKAHSQIFDIFLPILDEGRLKDSKGRDVSFKNTIIVFTSNIGATVLDRDSTAGSDGLMDELRKHFRPEFINRIDDIVPFYPLLFEDVRTILRQMVDRIRHRLKDKDIGIRMFQRAYEFLAKEGYKPEFGARELRRCVERNIADPIADAIIDGKFGKGDMIDVKEEDGKLVFTKGKRKDGK